MLVTAVECAGVGVKYFGSYMVCISRNKRGCPAMFIPDPWRFKGKKMPVFFRRLVYLLVYKGIYFWR